MRLCIYKSQQQVSKIGFASSSDFFCVISGPFLNSQLVRYLIGRHGAE